MFRTLEELQEKYPIGSTYHISWGEIGTWCPNKNENDCLVFKKEHPNARNFKYDNTTGFYTAEEKREDKIEGYLFDGEYWHPAVQSWDSWQTIDEEDCNV